MRLGIPSWIEAAKKYKIKGYRITLSEEQYKRDARNVSKREGLSDYLEVRLMDYRDLLLTARCMTALSASVCSEHVGRENYQLYLDCVSKVTKDGGLFLLHFISALKEHPGDPWIKKYIFPGGSCSQSS